MNITHVTYRRLRSHPSRYGHDALEAQAQISEGESAEQALENLRAWVLARLAEINHTDDVVEKIKDLDHRVESREHQLERMRSEVEQAKSAILASEKVQALARAVLSSEEMQTLFGDDEIPF